MGYVKIDWFEVRRDEVNDELYMTPLVQRCAMGDTIKPSVLWIVSSFILQKQTFFPM